MTGPDWKKNGWNIALLSVGVLVLVALILNLAQGGLWVVSGTSGKSAYELAVENGFQGSLQEWLDSLAGANGQDGSDGSDGQNGKSAYELAVENGFRVRNGCSRFPSERTARMGRTASTEKTARMVPTERTVPTVLASAASTSTGKDTSLWC